MNVLEGAIRRPVAAALIAIGVMLLGALAYRGLAVATLPAVDVPTIVVTAQLPGASPETMATSVATPLERRLGRMAGVTELTSINTLGDTQITIQFETGRDIDGAATDVQAAISAASQELPRDMPQRPNFKKINPILAPAAFLAVTSDVVPPDQLYEYVNTVVVQKIAQLEGVGAVTVQGAARSAVRVRVSTAALASVGLSLEDLRTAIRRGSANKPKGSLDGPLQYSVIVANDQLSDASDYTSLIIASEDGAQLRLGDVASVLDSVVDTRVGGWYNEQKAIFVFVQRKPGANIVATTDRLAKALPQIRRWLPSAVNIDIVADRTITIRGALADAQMTYAFTTALVVLTMFVFLRNIRITLISSVAIPVSLLGTFGVMYLLDYSLDIISLTALTVAVGFAVDDSIVMIENIVRYREMGYDIRTATLKGARQMTFTIIAITLSLVAAFIPFLLFPGVAGVLMREFSVTLSAAIIISALVSLTLTPALCATFMRDDQHSAAGWVGRMVDGAFMACAKLYEKSLMRALRHERLMLFITLAIMAGTITLYGVLPKGFMPTQDTGVIFGITEAPSDTSFAAMRDRQLAISRLILEDPAVENVNASIGSSSVETGGGSASISVSRFYIGLKPLHQRDHVSKIIARLRPKLAEIPGVTTYLQPVEDFNVGAREGKGQYQYTLQDENWGELDRTFPGVMEVFRALPQLTDIGADLQEGGLQLALEIDRDNAAKLGVSPRDIDETLYNAFGQRRVAVISTSSYQRYVVMEADPGGETDPSVLDNIYIRAPDGASIPLRAVTKMAAGTTAISIPHQGEFPSITISFNLKDDVALSDAVSAIETKVAALNLPPTLRATFQGKAGAYRSQSGSEPFLLIAAILTVYIVLGVLYESYAHPFTILSSLPSAGAGALLALWATGLQLTLIAFIGIILLVGIVKKTAIIMIDFALAAEREQGATPREAILAASRLRFRPIIMTNITALLGVLPLALGTGPGFELRQPLGVAIVGGLLFSSVITLYTTPVIYLYMDRLPRLRWRRRASA